MIPRRAILLAAAERLRAETKGLIYASGKGGGNRSARAQTLQALRATELKPKDILSTTAYLTDPKHLPDVDLGYRDFFGEQFPARTELIAGLRTPGGLVEISAVGCKSCGRRLIQPAFPASAAAEAAGTLYLSAVRGRGETVGKQTEQLMTNQNSVLAAAGFSFSDLVLSTIYLAEPAGYAALNEVYERFVTAPPPARATIHATAVRPGELLQVQSIAVRGSGAGRPAGEGHTSPIHSYSVKAGRRLYITGMTGRGSDGKFAPEITGQTRKALAMIEEQLRRHSMGFAQVVETTIWLRNLDDFAGLDSALPALRRRTVIEIPPTAEAALVEIQMIAEESR